MVALREAGTDPLSADAPSQLGRDVAIWGYMASALLNDAGVVPIEAGVVEGRARTAKK